MLFSKYFKKKPVAKALESEWQDKINASLRRERLSAMQAATQKSDLSGYNENEFQPFMQRSEFDNSNELQRLVSMLRYPDWVGYQDLLFMFTRHPLGYRICTTYPQHCWNPNPVVLEMDNQTGKPESPFELACAAIAAKVDLYGQMERADVCAQVGQYGVLYVDYNDKRIGNAPDSAKQEYSQNMLNPDTGKNYDSPPLCITRNDKVNWESIKGKGVDAINMVIPYQQSNAWPTQYITDTLSPSMGLVAYYNLQSGGQIFGSAQSTNLQYGAALPVTWNIVHASRCIHFCDRNVSNNILGIPALLPVFDDLMNSLRVSGGSAMVYQLNARGGLAMSIDQKENQSMDELDKLDFQKQADDYANGYRRILFADGLKVSPINHTFASPEKAVEVYNQNISAGVGIPASILVGNKTGRLASDEDQKMFYANLKTRQERKCSQWIRQFFDPLIANEVIPAPKNGTYRIFFPTLDLSDDTANATNYNAIVLALAALGNAKDAQVENEIPSFVNKAKEILKIKDMEGNVPIQPEDFIRPDLRVDDLEEVVSQQDDRDALETL